MTKCADLAASRPVRSLLLGLFGLVIGVQWLSAQYRFDSYSTDNGLPQNGVREIVQTPDGYLWFTTFDGLVRFDGVKFTVFDKDNSPGILNNRFYLLHLEKDGALYAATEGGGLTVYRDGVFRTFTTADGLPTNSIGWFRTDTNGEFVISAVEGNVYFRDGKFVPVPAAMFPDQGRFYLSPSRNLWFYGDMGTREVTADHREFSYPIKIKYFNDNYNGVSLFEDRRGDLSFGDLSGVYRLREGKYELLSPFDVLPPGTLLRPKLEDAAGGIWFISGWFGYTEKLGLVRYFNGQFSVWGESAGLASTAIGEIFADREGTIWAASDGGLNHLRREFVRSLSVPEGLVHRETYPILQTRNGDVYVGTIQGLSRYRDGKLSTVVSQFDGRYVSVSSLFEDNAGAVWVGAPAGLYKLENDRLRHLDEGGSDLTWSINQDASGDIWAGTEKGLLRLRAEKLVARYTTRDGLPGDDIKAVQPGKGGELWVGTYGGLASIAINGDQLAIKKFTTADGLASDRVRSIGQDPDGVLWIGTYDGGLSRLKDGKFFNYTVANGLFNNGVFQILDDDAGNFWISCNRGVYRVAKQELNDLAEGKIARLTSVAYGKGDGFRNTECNGGRQPAGIKAADGRLWFPTQDGVAIIDPHDVPTNATPPPVQIESVLVERRLVDRNAVVKLRADRDNLEIRYTGISFIKPDQVKFRYRIEGLNNSWTEVGTLREVYFPTLPAGEYTFHVIAANSDGVWNTEGARVRISVLAPIWKRTWFLVGAVLLLLLLLSALVFWRLRVLKNRQLAQQEFSRQLLQSQERERQRIAAELHDSLGQSLLIIKNRVALALDDVDEPETVKEQLEELSESAGTAIEECREISYNLRPYQIERFGLTKTLEAIFLRISEVTAIKTAIAIDPIDNLLTPDAEINIYRIIQESVNNIIKHSEANAASLTIEREQNSVNILIHDDGQGFDSQQITRDEKTRGGFGLIGMAERVRMLGGVYLIESLPGKGTTIRIALSGKGNDERS